MRTSRVGVLVMVGVLGGIVGAASPASAHPGENGRGGEHTNRYEAQGCQQGGHEARVEVETGRTFRNAGDCSSHTALGGTLAAASGQVTLTASAPYACAAPESLCWGTLSVTGAPTGAEIQVMSVTLGGAASLPVQAPDGSYSGPANIVCDGASPQEQFQAVVYDTPLRSLPITGATC